MAAKRLNRQNARVRKEYFNAPWQRDVWREIARLPEKERQYARQNFLAFLRAGKYRGHKGIIYGVSKKPFVLESGGVFLKGTKQPWVVVTEGLPRSSERYIVDHELLERAKGKRVTHSKKARQDPERKKALLLLQRLAAKRNAEAMREVKRFTQTKQFQRWVSDCTKNFERYKKTRLRMVSLEGVIEKARKANLPNALQDKVDAIRIFLQKRTELKHVSFEGKDLSLYYSPGEAMARIGFSRDIFWIIDLLTGKKSFLKPEFFSGPKGDSDISRETR